MPQIRQWDFLTGFANSELPSSGDVSATGDLITKLYADANYTPRPHVRGKVSDLPELKAIPASERFHEQQVFLAGTGKVYEFDENSSATPDDDFTVQPTVGTGRWLKKIDGGATVGGGSGVGISLLEQKLDQEHLGNFTDPLPVSIASSFSEAFPTVEGRLLADYASGTTAHICWNPKFLEEGVDENTDSAANWAVHDAVAINLTTSGTAKIGAASLSFDKTTGGTFAGIYNDRGAPSLYINGNGQVFLWVTLPSLTNLSNIELRLGDSTNFEAYTETTDHAGNALIVGDNLMMFDVSVPGVATGTGWSIEQGVRRFTIGVNTSSAAQTYTGILIDSIMFGLSNPERLVQIGNEYSIYDASNLANLQIDSTSVRVQGTIVLNAALGDPYDGGDVSSIRRNTMEIAGDGAARMIDGLSGEVADTQTIRIQEIFPESTSGANMRVVLDVETNMLFEVTNVVDSDTIEVDDPVNLTANIVSGRVFHVFQVLYKADGKKSFEYRMLDLTVSSSSHSSGTTTINTGTNTGIAVGDIVILKAISNAAISVVAKGSEETFSNLTLDTVQLVDTGMPYINPQYLYSHWYAGGKNTVEATRNRKGTAGALSIIGTPNLAARNFLGGVYAGGGFDDSNYLKILDPSGLIDGVGEKIQLSLWIYAAAMTGTNRTFISKSDSADEAWRLKINASASTITFITDAVNRGTLSFNFGQWTHIFLRVQSSANNNQLWVNGIGAGSTSFGITASANFLAIGRSAGGVGEPAIDVEIAQPQLWIDGPDATQGQINGLYNQGIRKLTGFAPKQKNYFDANGQTGQKATLKANLVRTTDTAIHLINKFGSIRTN